jgi:hypothetical protein
VRRGFGEGGEERFEGSEDGGFLCIGEAVHEELEEGGVEEGVVFGGGGAFGFDGCNRLQVVGF